MTIAPNQERTQSEHWVEGMRWKWKWKSLSPVRLFATPWTNTVPGILQARILEWAAFPFSSGSSQPRNRTRVSCIAGGFFTNWAMVTSLPKSQGSFKVVCPWGLLWGSCLESSKKNRLQLITKYPKLYVSPLNEDGLSLCVCPSPPSP